jgi:hypothetical protein
VAQFKVTLGDDLRAKLDAAAAASGESLAEEIRARVEQTIRDEADFDARTLALGRDVMRLSRLIERHAEVPWHGHAAARAAFVSAFARYLEGYTPQPDGPGQIAPAMARPGAAEAVGRVIGTNFLHDLALEAKIEKTALPIMSARQFKQLKRNLGDPGNWEPQLELVKTPPAEPELVKPLPAPSVRKEKRKKPERT